MNTAEKMGEIDQRIIDARRRAREASEAGNARRAAALRGVVTRLTNQRRALPLAWPVARNEDDAERMEVVERMAPGWERDRAHGALCYDIARGTMADVEEYAARIIAANLLPDLPPTFTVRDHGRGSHDGWHVWPRDPSESTSRWVVVESDEAEVRIVFVLGVAPDFRWRDGRGPRVEVGGHLLYRLAGSWFTFTRHGIDCGSFDYDETTSPVAVVEEQSRRAIDTRDRRAAMVPVPGVPGLSPRIPEARIATDRALIEGGGAVTFRPGGFGTGYRVTRRRPHRHAHPAPEALCVFYGFESLWLDPMDCD